MGNIVSGSVNLFLVYTTKDLGDGGRSEEKRHYAVNSKQKSIKNLFFSWFLPDVLTGWPILPTYPLIN